MNIIINSVTMNVCVALIIFYTTKIKHDDIM